MSSSLDHRREWLVESYALFKSIKAVNVCFRFNLQVSIKLVREDTWSFSAEVILPIS